MLFRWLIQGEGKPSRPQSARPGVELLETRAVPAVLPGPFFLGRDNALYAATGTPGQFLNTGGYGTALNVGTDLAGNPMAVIRDFNSRVYIYDQGTWLDTGGYARDLVAGRNGIFIARDFNNLVYRYQIGTGWAVAGSPGTGDVTPHYAVQLSLGQETVTNPVTGAATIGNVVYTRAPGQHVQVYRDLGFFDTNTDSFLATFRDTGGFATDLAAGYQGEAYIRDGNNQLYYYNGTWHATGAWAFSLDVGTTSGGNDYLAFKDANSQIYIYQPSTSSFIATGGYAVQVAAAANEVFIRDFNNDVHYFALANQNWTDLGHFASLLRVTSLSSAPGAGPDGQALGEVWAIDADAGMAGQFVFFDGSWNALGFPGQDVEGYRGT